MGFKKIVKKVAKKATPVITKAVSKAAPKVIKSVVKQASPVAKQLLKVAKPMAIAGANAYLGSITGGLVQIPKPVGNLKVDRQVESYQIPTDPVLSEEQILKQIPNVDEIDSGAGSVPVDVLPAKEKQAFKDAIQKIFGAL